MTTENQVDTSIVLKTVFQAQSKAKAEPAIHW